MKRRTLSRSLVVISIVSALTLSACGTGSSSDTTIGSSTPVKAEFNDDDAMFAQMMIPHHEQAVELAVMALNKASLASSAIQEIANNINMTQGVEIDLMKQSLEKWGQPYSAEDASLHSSMMEGMLSDEELDSLRSLTGTAFDKAWAKGMIAHHEGAIQMAQDVTKDGVNSTMRTLAQVIISTQTAEIATLRALLK